MAESDFTIPVSGGSKELELSDVGNFTVHRIEGLGYNSGQFPNKTERDPRNRRYTIFPDDPKKETYMANMHLAVFYNRGEAIHLGKLDESSHGCIHVNINNKDHIAKQRKINYHSVKGLTKVSVLSASASSRNDTVGIIRASSLRVREEPKTKKSRIIGRLSRNDAVLISCAKEGEAVSGNKIWFKTDAGFISSVFVDIGNESVNNCKKR